MTTLALVALIIAAILAVISVAEARGRSLFGVGCVAHRCRAAAAEPAAVKGTVYLYPDKSAVFSLTDMELTESEMARIRAQWDKWRAEPGGLAVLPAEWDVILVKPEDPPTPETWTAAA